MERIDKIIAKAENISRTDARALIKKGLVTIDGKIIRDIGQKADELACEIICNGSRLCYSEFVYIMMNKPKGVISASDGGADTTVVDILPQEMKRKNLFPAGRLDKDTTGFVLITDDGGFAHRILSPKNHIPKTYIAKLDKPFDAHVMEGFKQGVRLNTDICMPAELEAVGGDYTAARVTIRQGMYHQIKRMFSHYGLTVLELERIKMGDLYLDETLESGACRYLTDEELKLVESCK
ncbi:MAG: rRNA pseudouridine synthase [Clostridium sp.]|nr:rRNA pseudouridine synthase [Clostridium sp.]